MLRETDPLTRFGNMPLDEVDPEIAEIIEREQERQRDGLELIASENYTSRAVLQAVGSVLTNKDAEGYPGKRYYNGCENVDTSEALAISRADQTVRCRPCQRPGTFRLAGEFCRLHLALIQPGDTVLAMSLAQGGHLTHGAGVNISGQSTSSSGTETNQATEQIDYDELERLALEHQPKLIVSGATAYPRIDFERIRAICDKAGTR